MKCVSVESVGKQERLLSSHPLAVCLQEKMAHYRREEGEGWWAVLWHTMTDLIFILQHQRCFPPLWRQHGGRYTRQCFSAGGSGPKGGHRKLRQRVTAQVDDMLLKQRVCALEMNFGSWCSWEALRWWSCINRQSIRM